MLYNNASLLSGGIKSLFLRTKQNSFEVELVKSEFEELKKLVRVGEGQMGLFL